MKSASTFLVLALAQLPEELEVEGAAGAAAAGADGVESADLVSLGFAESADAAVLSAELDSADFAPPLPA